MATHIALLRAVNVGGRTLRMADLRACLEASGLEQVETYIQTGNVRFRTPMRSPARVQQHVEDTLREHCGFEVTTIVRTPAELTRVYADAVGAEPPLSGDGLRRYVMFLKDDPPAEAVPAIDGWDHDGERARVIGRDVHVWLAKPTHQARFSNARFERSLGSGTTRDLKVVARLAETWGG